MPGLVRELDCLFTAPKAPTLLAVAVVVKSGVWMAVGHVLTLASGQHAVQRVHPVVVRKISERGFDLESVPNYSAVHALRSRHSTICDHFVKFGITHADVARSLITG
jgi:hypothetical protein